MQRFEPGIRSDFGDSTRKTKVVVPLSWLSRSLAPRSVQAKKKIVEFAMFHRIESVDFALNDDQEWLDGIQGLLMLLMRDS